MFVMLLLANLMELFSSIYNSAEFLEEKEMQLVSHLQNECEGNHQLVESLPFLMWNSGSACVQVVLGFHSILGQ